MRYVRRKKSLLCAPSHATGKGKIGTEKMTRMSLLCIYVLWGELVVKMGVPFWGQSRFQSNHRGSLPVWELAARNVINVYHTGASLRIVLLYTGTPPNPGYSGHCVCLYEEVPLGIQFVPSRLFVLSSQPSMTCHSLWHSSSPSSWELRFVHPLCHVCTCTFDKCLLWASDCVAFQNLYVYKHMCTYIQFSYLCITELEGMLFAEIVI